MSEKRKNERASHLVVAWSECTRAQLFGVSVSVCVCVIVCLWLYIQRIASFFIVRLYVLHLIVFLSHCSVCGFEMFKHKFMIILNPPKICVWNVCVFSLTFFMCIFFLLHTAICVCVNKEERERKNYTHKKLANFFRSCIIISGRKQKRIFAFDRTISHWNGVMA